MARHLTDSATQSSGSPCPVAGARDTLAIRRDETRTHRVHHNVRTRKGFSILELMFVLAVSAILTTVAVVLYQEYAETARLGVLDASIASLEPFQEAHRLEHGSFAEGSWHLTSETDESLYEAIGWRPSSTQSADYSLEVTLIDNGFRVIAKNSFGQTICRDYPSRERCEA